ncbi:hypothetical protein [Streptomyces sp. MNU103]|uniref:hypothetical protein n=1 Tax=Streptomyces sp. MNU103 TaxID=2560024 RepID=UPI001E288F20|nr:hypothetical protein [Streptomyces sp. MNU103]
MAQFGCGGSRCTCQVVAGPGATVTGNGSPGAPYVISTGAAEVSCEDVRPCLSAGPGVTYDPDTGVIGAEPTLVEAGDGVTVTGTGAAGDPYVVAAEAADPTVVQAGDRTTVTGTGTAGDPYVVSADPPSCEDVRPCLSAGPGVTYDPDTGVIGAEPTLVEAGDGVTVTGTGAAGDPYVVSAEAADPTVVQAGDRVTVTGTGTAGDPYVVAAEAPSCEDVRPCLSAGPGVEYDPDTGVISSPPTAIEAGTNVTVTGTGTDADPYVVSSAGGGGVSTVVQAGDRTTVTGTGTAGDPYVVSADPPSCEDVRPCLVAGDGIDYDPDTGQIAARPSTDAGNTLGLGTDGGLLVPPAEPLETGCGLTGDGTAGAPLAAVVAAWPYACDLDENAGRVYCDSTGQLRSEPRPLATFVQDQQVLNPANLVVPTPQDTVVAEHTLVIDNPDPCRPAFVMVEGEADADFNLPPNSGAALGITTDEMSYVANNGATTLLDVHVQGTKVVNTTIPPGGSINFTITITMGRGSGGATYNRVQSYLRAFVFVL